MSNFEKIPWFFYQENIFSRNSSSTSDKDSEKTSKLHSAIVFLHSSESLSCQLDGETLVRSTVPPIGFLLATPVTVSLTFAET